MTISLCRDNFITKHSAIRCNWRVPKSFIQSLNQTATVLEEDPFVVIRYNAVQKWGIFVTKNNSERTSIYLIFFQFMRIHFSTFLDFLICFKWLAAVDLLTTSFCVSSQNVHLVPPKLQNDVINLRVTSVFFLILEVEDATMKF